MGLLKLKKEEPMKVEEGTEKKEEKVIEPRFKLAQVPKDYEVVILDTETNETMDLMQAVVELRNDFNELAKFIKSL